MNLGVGVILVEWETECRLSLNFTLGCMVLGDPIGWADLFCIVFIQCLECLALSSHFVYKAVCAIDDEMPRVKWDTLTDESQAMVKKVGLFSIGGIILLFFSKMIFPLVVLGGGGFVAWRALNKKWWMKTQPKPSVCSLPGQSGLMLLLGEGTYIWPGSWELTLSWFTRPDLLADSTIGQSRMGSWNLRQKFLNPHIDRPSTPASPYALSLSSLWRRGQELIVAPFVFTEVDWLLHAEPAQLFPLFLRENVQKTCHRLLPLINRQDLGLLRQECESARLQRPFVGESWMPSRASYLTLFWQKQPGCFNKAPDFPYTRSFRCEESPLLFQKSISFEIANTFLVSIFLFRRRLARNSFFIPI